MIYLYYLTSEHLGTERVDEPIGAARLKTKFTRSETYHGIMTTFSEERLEFVGKAAGYIRTLFEREGIDAQITIWIELSEDGGQTTEVIYRGRLDMSRYSFDRHKRRVVVGLEHISPLQLLMNRSATAAEITRATALDGTALQPLANTPRSIALHSKALLRKFEAVRTEAEAQIETEAALNGSVGAGSGEAFRTTIFRFYYNLGRTNINEAKRYVAPGERLFVFDANSTEPADFPCFISEDGGSLKISLAAIATTEHVTVGRMRVSRRLFRLVLRVGNQPRQILREIIMEGNPANKVATVNLQAEIELNLSPEAEVTIYYEYVLEMFIQRDGFTFNFAIRAKHQIELGSYLRITNTSTTPTGSNCRVVPVLEAFYRTIDSVTDGSLSRGAMGFASSHYGRTNAGPLSTPANGLGAFRVVTNGYNIRSFRDRPIYATIEELYRAFDAADCIGMGMVEDPATGFVTIHVERRRWFFSSVVLASLTAVRSIQEELASSWLYNEVAIGSQEWQTESFAGLDEPNAQRQYSTGLKQAIERYDALSPYVLGGYPIEITRRQQFVDGSNQDTDYDERNFIICVVPAMDRAERDERLDGALNLLDPPSIYNADLNPSRSLKRHAGFIGRSMRSTKIEGNQKYQLVWKPTEGPFGTSDLLTDNSTFGGDQLDIRQLPATELPLNGRAYRFTTQLTRQQVRAIRRNPYGIIEATDAIGMVRGYIQELSLEELTGKAEFYLIGAN